MVLKWMEVIQMEPCRHEDDKCEYWYMGLCELDDRLNVCPYDPLYKQLQEFGSTTASPNNCLNSFVGIWCD